MFSNAEDQFQQNEKNLIYIKREEYRAEIRKQKNENQFRLKRKIIKADNIQQLNMNDTLNKVYNGLTADEQYNINLLKEMFDLSSFNDDNKQKFLFDEKTIQLLTLVLQQYTNQNILENLYGLLANLATLEEYQNFNQDFIQVSIQIGAKCLTQYKTMQVQLIDNILIYISNLSDKNPILTSLFINQDILSSLNQIAEYFSIKKFPLDNIFYIVNTLFINSQTVKESQTIQAIQIISNGLNNLNDVTKYEMQVALSNVVTSSVLVVNELMKTNLLEFILQQLRSEQYFIALKTLKHVSAVEDIEPIFVIQFLQYKIKYLVQNLVLDDLIKFILSDNFQKRKIALLILQNIAYSNSIIIDLIVNHQIFTKMINFLVIQRQRNEEYSYALCFFLNVLAIGNSNTYQKLIELDLIKIICRFLDFEEKQILIQAIECLRYFCKFGSDLQAQNNLDQNIIVRQLKCYGITPKLEKLQLHKNEDVFKASQKLLIEYFDYE